MNEIIGEYMYFFFFFWFRILSKPTLFPFAYDKNNDTNAEEPKPSTAPNFS